MNQPIIRRACAIAVVAAATACGASMPSSETTTTSASLPIVSEHIDLPPVRAASPEDAAYQIATTRCAREYDCGDVGERKVWTSYDECVQAVRQAERDAFVGASCTHGINPYALASCIRATRASSCAPPVVPSGVGGCSSMDLCL